MKLFLARMLAKMNLVLLPFLAKFGIWGIGALALLDSSSIPVPMDAFIAYSVWNDKGRFWLYCLLAAAGSAIGGLLPYGLGRAGGELFLLKRVNRERYERMRARFEKQEFLAMMIPSMMPPPTPWKAFVFAAGVFEMRIVPFLLSVFCGRMVRWLILSQLVLKLDAPEPALSLSKGPSHLETWEITNLMRRKERLPHRRWQVAGTMVPDS